MTKISSNTRDVLEQISKGNTPIPYTRPLANGVKYFYMVEDESDPNRIIFVDVPKDMEPEVFKQNGYQVAEVASVHSDALDTRRDVGSGVGTDIGLGVGSDIGSDVGTGMPLRVGTIPGVNDRFLYQNPLSLMDATSNPMGTGRAMAYSRGIGTDLMPELTSIQSLMDENNGYKTGSITQENTEEILTKIHQLLADKVNKNTNALSPKSKHLVREINKMFALLPEAEKQNMLHLMKQASKQKGETNFALETPVEQITKNALEGGYLYDGNQIFDQLKGEFGKIFY